ncbi:MAG TPA: ferritin family protein [Armatimonadota bacterium]|jgi:rubrerythrin
MLFEKLEDILDFAIAKEIEAVDFYGRLAVKVKDRNIYDELMKMAAMEEKHRDWLQENSVALVSSNSDVPVQNLKTADFTIEPQPAADLTWPDIINLAMHREATAVNLYENLAQIVTDPSAKQMFLNLASEESRHRLYFETLWDEEVMIED